MPSRSAAIVRHELRILRSDPLYLVVFTLLPLVVMGFVKPAFKASLLASGTPGANGAEQAVPGIAVMFALLLIGSVGFSFLREEAWGTWRRIRTCGASPTELLIGKVVVPLGQSSLQMLILLGVGGAIYDLRVKGSMVALVFVAAAFSVCLVCLGLALVAISRSMTQLNALATLGGMLLASVGGALTPFDSMPGWAQAIAPITPSYWAMRGFRSVVIDGGGLSEVILPVGVLALMAIAFLTMWASTFRYAEAKTV